MKNWVRYLLLLAALVITGMLTTCKVPYNPPPITAVSNYLVVEGLINLTDSTYINLSRTVGVMSASTVKPELKAIVTIENNQGGSYPLSELGKGVYAAAPLNLSAANQYRLRIKTSNGNTYTSDFVQAKVTPPIDTVIWQAQSNGMYITVNAHDATNNTRYYRWDYNETWEFYTYLISGYLYNGTTLVPRTAAQENHHCWGYDSNASVLLASTATLSQDILLNAPITFIPIASEKLSIKYSILIKQYALTADAYNYWTLLKKNTEQLGSIFDAQPSASIGNLQNINNPAEVVIGFISAGTVSQTRIFIDHTVLPLTYSTAYTDNTPYNQYTCFITTGIMAVDYPSYFNLKNPILTPIAPGEGGEPGCTDCTIRGSNVQPSYWP